MTGILKWIQCIDCLQNNVQYLLVCGGEIVPDFHWTEDSYVEVAACDKHLFNINEQIVELSHTLEH